MKNATQTMILTLVIVNDLVEDAKVHAENELN